MAQVSNETEAMVWKRPSFCGKGVTDEEWNILHEVIDSCGLSRHELASTICESLGWVRANGNLKSQECYEYLDLLEAGGLVELPRRRGPTSIHYTKAGRKGSRREGNLSDVAPVTLGLVAHAEERALWRELVERYHYLRAEGGLWRTPALLGLELEISS